jgi:hypothetical protein
MVPSELKPADFERYPPKAKQLATAQMDLLRRMPLAFVPLLLREVIAYDWKFPVEQAQLDKQFAWLGGMSSSDFEKAMAPFAQLRLSPQLERDDWVNAPGQFSEQLSAHLWATRQIDTFRAASIAYVHDLNAAKPEQAPAVQRLGISVIGYGVAQNQYPLFRKLRPHGVYFRNVDPENGLATLLDYVADRAREHPVPFGHWYIDGAENEVVRGDGVTTVCYASLGAVRSALIDKMRRVMQPGGAGPEALRTMLAALRPEDLGLNGEGTSGVLNHFQISVLTEGSGTQLFSTTFVQWSAREALRRAQPLTLLLRFTPRVHEQSMRELLAGVRQKPMPDPPGSLVDADMGAYYTWINQQRLIGAERAAFLVWFEGHNEALAIGPALPRGTESPNPVNLRQILEQMG